MKNFKNFYLSYTNDTLCKRSLKQAKNYFDDFFRKDITENSELARLYELRKLILESSSDPTELELIENKIIKLNSNCVRNAKIFKEVEDKINELQEVKNNYHEVIYQAIYLKNIIKYYPNQEEYVLKDYGVFVFEIAKELLNSDEDKIIYLASELLKFFEEYKFAIRLAIESLKSMTCNLIKVPKINHALQLGYEAYLLGSLKNDGVTAAILSDALQYSHNAKKVHARVEMITKEFSGAKVLNIYYKTGQKPELLEKPWKERKKYQIELLKTPGTISFSALVILLIGKRITLYEISKLFAKYKNEFISSNPAASTEEIEAYMNKKKSKFWHKYASITENDAKEYYSELAVVLNKIKHVPEFLYNEYEDYYLEVFGQYPF